MSYPKIQGLYKRYREGSNKGKFIIGEYTRPEFKLLKDIIWEFTEKLDGTNTRVIYQKDEHHCRVIHKGKKEKSQIPDTLNKYLLRRFNNPKTTLEFSRIFKCGATIFGEGIGYKIQKGCKYFGGEKKNGFVAFDININGTWLDRDSVEMICNELKIPVVPRIGRGTIEDAINLVKKNPKSKYGNFTMEGLVIRPTNELLDRRRHRIITKIKTKDFKEE